MDERPPTVPPQDPHVPEPDEGGETAFAAWPQDEIAPTDPDEPDEPATAPDEPTDPARVAHDTARDDDVAPERTPDEGDEAREAATPSDEAAWARADAAVRESALRPVGDDATVLGTDQPDAPAHEPAVAAAPTAMDAAPNGWLVLARALRPRANRAQLFAAVLCALLGFALVVQVRQNDESALSGLRQSELVRILDETTDRGDQLRQEVVELRGQRDELLSGSDRQEAALDSLRRSAITQGILSGRLPAQGPGVRVTLLDPQGDLQPVTMLNMLEELRNAGAEAIQLNDRRVTASSAFTGTRGAIELDGVPLEAPFTWLAIGDPDTLSIALQIPGGAMATVRGTGASGEVEELDEVQVSAVRELEDPQYATPVAPDGE
ncbi:DUF881 domain-containing protein [Cellulomonas gilvus]|uniref:Division initiation protein n=1 Tax=Cellulomonas gilvus (strain ATCC 13127 / NRRL B-14078) TaxID=593907 RepID=F8A660_CELGA|nr:DUF881 domain-containing protein [Cellulomonas gilvus]AEI12216.1 protein of unknown function DUF881 [Cellulomonas gilvus ATCC 13127]